MVLTPKRLRLLLSHAAAAALGFALSWFIFDSRASVDINEITASYGRFKAASVAYTWGTKADAQAQLVEYIRKVTSSPPQDPIAQMDVDLAKLRLAIVTEAPHDQVLQLCARSRFGCSSDAADRFVAKLRAERRVP